MPQQLTYPGVYIEEIPSGVRTIVGVATSITAFAGRTSRGSTDEAVPISSYGEFVQLFGGLWDQSGLGFAVRDFYLNGGRQALIARVYDSGDLKKDGKTRLVVGAGPTRFTLVATSPGAWGNGLRVTVDQTNLPNPPRFNLTIVDTDADQTERIAGVSLYSDDPRRIDRVLELESQLVRFDPRTPLLPPPPAGARVRPAEKATDKASQAEGDGKAATAQVGTATAKLPAARQALAAAQNELATAQQTQRDKDKAKEKADQDHKKITDSLPGLKGEHDAALKAKQNAEALPDTDPTKKRKVERATADEVATKQALDDATAAEKDAATTATTASDAAKDAAKAVDQATKNRDDAINEVTKAQQAVTDAKDAAQAELNKVADAFGDDKGSDGVAPSSPDEFWEKRAAPLLAKADILNLLCIPPYKPDGADVEPALYENAAAFCRDRRALLLVDPPSIWRSATDASDGFKAEPDQVGARSVGRNAALFFPRLRQPNPLLENTVQDFVPCGAVAGVFARTDAARGVWKAPAGLEAALVGVPELSVPLNDDGNGLCNRLGINCLRSFPVAGRVVWGSRTLVGADVLASEWKYVPVRRLALFLEESLYRGTQWVVFEPNDEPLWAQIRLNGGAFMQDLFRQGAFQGKTPRDAYLVKCDAETTTQTDRDRGIVNIVVGFAPLKPAEFVVIRLQQLAGQTET